MPVRRLAGLVKAAVLRGWQARKLEGSCCGIDYFFRLDFLPQRFSFPRAGREPWLALLLRQLSFPLRLRCAISYILYE